MLMLASQRSVIGGSRITTVVAGHGGSSSSGNGSQGPSGAVGANSDAGTPRLAAYALTILPPLACAAAVPDIFFSALDIAGTYGVMTLFGVLPAVLAWRQRAQLRNLATNISTNSAASDGALSRDWTQPSEDACARHRTASSCVVQMVGHGSSAVSRSNSAVVLVPGGNAVLLGIGLAAISVIGYELVGKALLLGAAL
jgi:hypothetical protein